MWRAFHKAHHLYNRNEEKNKKRKQYLEDRFGYQEGLSELHSSAIDDDDVMDTVITKKSIEYLREVLVTLPEMQSRRLLLFYSGYTYSEIAVQENVCVSTITRSIKTTMKKIKKYF